MDQIRIDPNQGWHSAAGLSDRMLRYLLDLALSELAMRLGDDAFEEFVADSFARRFQDGDFIETLRKERDMMMFAAQVMADIQRLPVTAGRGTP